MDFHALPRRDLQALCKRNAVRANMTNAAMADALRALPTVDGIEEYVKQTVAMPTPAAKAVAEEEPREKQGSLLPCGRRVTVKSPEPIRPEDGEKEDEDLKRDTGEEKAPALGVGRRGPSRRDRAAPVVAPTTRRRAAAANKSEAGDVAVEAVPAPTTRRRIQSTVPMEAEEKVTRARRMSRRAAARNTGMQQEEEEEKPQGVVSYVETVPALPVSDEGCDDPEEVEGATNPQNEEESVQEDEALVSDVESTVPAPVSDEVCDDAEDVEEATKSQNEEEDDVVEESSQEDEGVVMDTPTPVEEEPPVVEECKDKSAVQEPQVNVQQCAAPLPSQESPFRDGTTGSGEAQLDEEMADAIHHASEEMEMVPVSELPQAMLTAGETIEEVCFTGDAGHANEEENEVAAFSELLQHGKAETSEAGTEGFLCEEKEDVTVDEVLHDTVTGHDTILLDFSGKISRAVEEEGVVSVDEMPQSSMKTDKDADEDDFDMDTCRADEQKDVVTVDNVSQVTVTNNEVVGYENVFSSDMPPELSSAGDLGDHNTSPFIADMLDNVTKSVSNNVIDGEPTVSEEDVSKCMRSHSIENRSTELVAVEEENEMKDKNQNKEPLVLTKLSLRKLRAKLKETLIAHEEPLVSTKLSLRKLRAKLKETLIAHEGKEAKRVALARLDNKSAIILTRRNS